MMTDGQAALIELKNERLSVEISYPGTDYKGSRFDWNGFIRQVTLDGKHTFCVPESLISGKGSGGQGFCGEFGIEEALGYHDCCVEDYFTKIGVGLLKRLDEKPYDFFRTYPIIPVNSSITATAGKVEFNVKTLNNNGYAYDYTKEISLDQNYLTIDYSLSNTGSKKIETTEYCHNFLGIDGEQVCGNYSLKLPCEFDIQNRVGEFHNSGNIIAWPDTEMKREFYCIIKDYRKNPHYSWELYNLKAGVGVRENDSFEVSKFALWGSRHVISPETFIKFELETGNSMTWSRKYEFYY